MEIKNLNNSHINTYKSLASKTNKEKNSSGAKKTSDNFDKVEFDFDRSISAAKSDIAAIIAADSDASRLEDLKQAYAGDSSPVAPEQIAGAIVD